MAVVLLAWVALFVDVGAALAVDAGPSGVHQRGLVAASLVAASMEQADAEHEPAGETPDADGSADGSEEDDSESSQQLSDEVAPLDENSSWASPCDRIPLSARDDARAAFTSPQPRPSR